MRRTAVVVTDRQILPVRAGNHARILGVLRGLRALGWRIALVVPEDDGVTGIEKEADELFRMPARPFSSGDVDRFDVRPYRLAVDRAAERVKPSVAIAEYAWLAPALRHLPSRVLRMVDCHDVLHERTSRFSEAGLDPWVRCTAAQERRLLKHADVLLASQHREAAVLKRLLPRRRVCCLLPHVDLDPEFRPTHAEAPLVVLAVGAAHPGNEGILKFAVNIWPTVLPHQTNMLLRVVGSIGNGMPPLPRVEWVPYVENLADCYHRAPIVVCPVEVGTGAKIKVLEALRYGKAIVATPAAVEGLVPPVRPAWLSANSLVECGQAVQMLLESPAHRMALSEQAFAYGEQHLSRQRFLADLQSLLPGMLARLTRHIV
jgi:glycosyltransferase involved in cell wall biosynthesis